MDIKVSMILPLLAAFAISAVLGPVVIPFLRRLKFGQYIRDEGPKMHQIKSGTPTMGGTIFIVSVTVTSVFFMRDYPQIIPILFVTLGFGLVGFFDDYMKVVHKRNLGLTKLQKLTGQFLVTAVFLFYILYNTDVGSKILIPFTGGMADGLYWQMPVWLYTVFAFVTVLATVNGANFTDGLDGLMSGVTVLIAVFFTVVAVAADSGIHPVTAAVVGSLLGFLLFNVHPARVFMGDTGSLALGGFVAGTAIVMRLPLFILIVGIIYAAELISVVVQVMYFKITHGRRILKMAPLHHHFELTGWPETRVVAVFSIMTALACMIGFLAL